MGDAGNDGGTVGMTKSELIARLAQRYPQLVAKDAEYAVKMILDAMNKLQSQTDSAASAGSTNLGALLKAKLDNKNSQQ